MTVDLVLLILSFVCFAIAALNPPWPRFNLIALGLAFWVLTLLVK